MAARSKSGTAERNNLRRRLLRRIPRNTAPPLEPPSVAVRRRCLHCGLLSAGEWPGGVAERAWPRAYATDELYTALRKVALSGQLSPGRVVRVAERERERERGGVEFQFRFNAVWTQREIVKKNHTILDGPAERPARRHDVSDRTTGVSEPGRASTNHAIRVPSSGCSSCWCRRA